jgi:hypothetical protein
MMAPKAQAQTFTKIADTSTAIPNGTGPFTSVGVGPSISNSTGAFRGTGSGSQVGIYTSISNSGTFTVVADNTTQIPNSSGTFINLQEYQISSSRIVFAGGNTPAVPPNTITGLYSRAVNGGDITTLVDTTTLIPGGSGTFTLPFASFGFFSVSSATVAFTGTGSNGQIGIYTMPATGGW